MNTLDLLKCGAAIAIEVAVFYAIGKLATRFTASAHWQRTIWQATFIAMIITFAGEVNGVRGLFASDPALQERIAKAVSISEVSLAPIEFIEAPLIATEATLARGEPEVIPPRPGFSTFAILGWCWVIGAALLLFRMSAALFCTIVFRLAAERVTDSTLVTCLDRLKELLGLRRHVELRQTGRVSGPFTFGVVRPVIVLPRRFTETFNLEQQQLALLHELAHIAALDAVWRVIANVMSVLLWWHPMVWLARRELFHASEAAADEASLVLEDGPAQLADCLLQCARQLKPSQRHFWIGMGGFRSSIGKRIERLLSLETSSQSVSKPATWLMRLVVPLVSVFAIWAVAVSLHPVPSKAWSNSLVGSLWASTARGAQATVSNENPPPATSAAALAASKDDNEEIVQHADKGSLHTQFFKVNTDVLLEDLQKRFGTNASHEIPKTAPVIDEPSVQPSLEKRYTGISSVTPATTVIPLIKKHFSSLGVNLDEHGKAVFFNDRRGFLMVRATLQELRVVEVGLKEIDPESGPGGKIQQRVQLRMQIFDVPQLTPGEGDAKTFGAAGNTAPLLGILTEQQARLIAASAGVSTGKISSAILLVNGEQATFDLNKDRRNADQLVSISLIPYVQSNGVIQLTVLPSFTEFLGYDDPAGTDWATGGPYAPADRFNRVVPFTGPRFRLRQNASTAHLFDGQSVVVGPLDVSRSAVSNSMSGACVITVRLLDENDRPIRTPEELQSFKTVPQQPSATKSNMSKQAAIIPSREQNQAHQRELGEKETNLSGLPIVGRLFRDPQNGDAFVSKVMADTQPTKRSEQEQHSVSSNTNAPPLYAKNFKINPTTFTAYLSSITTRDAQTGGMKRLFNERDLTNSIQSRLDALFTAAGVDLKSPGKAVLYNERAETLMVRGTLADIDAVQRAVELLNIAPPLIEIEVKATEVPVKAIRDGSLNLPMLGTVAVNGASSNAPAIAAAALLTGAQFARALHSLENIRGADVLSMRPVTMMSGRQAQIKVVDVRHIVTDVDITTNAAPAKSRSWWPFGRARDKRDIRPISEAFELGPVIDVVPTVEADGYTIQMTVLPTLREFLGYDDPGTFQVESGGTVSPTPLPKFRIRQVATSARVWDGQTLVIGAGQAPAKDGTPRELISFITPRLIDPAGNPVHREDDLEEASVPAAPAPSTRVWANPVR